MNGRDMSFFSSCGEREKRASRQILEPTLAVVHIIKRRYHKRERRRKGEEGRRITRRGASQLAVVGSRRTVRAAVSLPEINILHLGCYAGILHTHAAPKVCLGWFAFSCMKIILTLQEPKPRKYNHCGKWR